ncbi:MAG: hypothetical protein VB035_07470 [Candidatus Fimivivens sp.]|nr:hypothetical protein [Candidatus Fimivivens sp.]
MDTPALTGRDPSDSNALHNSYYFELSIHGNRALLAKESVSLPGKKQLTLTPIGNAIVAIWQTLPQRFPSIVTDIFYLMPDGISAILTLDALSGEETAALRLLNRAVSYFKAETTRFFNSASSQDYHSRLWVTTFRCEIIATSTQLTELQQKLAAQGAYQISDFNSQITSHNLCKHIKG